VAYTAVMLAVSLMPVLWLGTVYGIATVGLGGGFLGLAIRAVRREDGASALALFHYSLAYLALLFMAAALASAVRL
jgi:protoheme IX farnesyltransferase